MTDVTPVTIQASSRAMMRHYDHTPTIAVNEWRNSIQTCDLSQLLPLLYVANEVLQTSKRNRGNTFLEAFSPVLATSTRFICERDRSIVEKVRRVIKIWGDRRVFSVRFVGELLGGLDMFRNDTVVPPKSNPNTNANKMGSTTRRPHVTPNSPQHSDRNSSNDDDDDGSDSESSFIASNGPSLLQLDVKIDVNNIEQEKITNVHTPRKSFTRKRARDHFDDESNDITSHKKAAGGSQSKKRNSHTAPKTKIYSTSTLLDLLKRTEDLTAEFQAAKGAVEGCPSSHFSTDPNSIIDLVGDDLVEMHDEVRYTGKLLWAQRKKMYHIAKERKELEVDAVKFIPFLKDSLKQDDNELQFCDKMEEKIKLLAVVIDAARTLRDKKRQLEEEKQRQMEAEKRRMEEEAERKKSLESAKKDKSEEPGMVYNPATRDFQYVHDHTEDDWRN